MENKGGRFRKKKYNFSIISNSVIRNENLSLKAKGLYCLIQSYITMEDFTLYKWFLQSKCCEGKKAFESAWQELKKTGYLVQYRMQDAVTKQFYWEYELLDEPCTQKGYDGLEGEWERDITEKVGDINNTIDNNTLPSNTNLIISISDVMDQIDFSTFSTANVKQVTEIALLITEVLNTDDEKMIWVSRDDVKAAVVKERFRMLNKFHIEYVLECLKNNSGKINNIKNYLLTSLYNAPLTINTYYQNKVKENYL